MKHYTIDELRPEDYHRLKKYMDDNFKNSGIDNLYWIPLKILTEVQTEHSSCCGPFYFAAELENDRLCCELLVRCQQKIRCNCIKYADLSQRNWLINKIDLILEELEISI